MKKQTFIKLVHKALRNGGVLRGENYWDTGLRYDTFLSYDKTGMTVEIVSSRNSSIQKRHDQTAKVKKVLTDAGIKNSDGIGSITLYIDFKDNGVEL